MVAAVDQRQLCFLLLAEAVVAEARTRCYSLQTTVEGEGIQQISHPRQAGEGGSREAALDNARMHVCVNLMGRPAHTPAERFLIR